MEFFSLPLVAWFVFLAAAALEVGGDAVVRKGLQVLRGGGPGGLLFVVLGFVMLGCYGLVVNLVNWNFSKLLGVYVAVFAVVSVLTGKFLLGEQVPLTTWGGLVLIVAGAVVIQLGQS
jgi:multidrug transporter EmrE-like cation transporter